MAYERPVALPGGYRSAQVPLHIPSGLTKRLRGLGQRQRATLFTTLVAALTAVLGRHAEHGDVAVTTLVAGRRQTEYQRLVGLFSNPVVVRTRLAGARSFADLLSRAGRGVLEANSRQDAPFPLVADRARIAAAEVWLNVAPPPPRSRFRGLEVDTQALPRDYPIDVPAESWRGEKLICNLTDSAEIVGLFDYNTHLLDRPAVEELYGQVYESLYRQATPNIEPILNRYARRYAGLAIADAGGPSVPIAADLIVSAEPNEST